VETAAPPPDPAPPADRYDSRYLAGVGLFNRAAYFDAHEVWEELWLDCPAADRRFYQALIQAAVALHHWGNGNAAGATRLFHSGRRYMEPFRPTHRGLDVDRFWPQVEAALAAPPGSLVPRIELNPPPPGGLS
jgi:predicted metal-dependent hydrolase